LRVIVCDVAVIPRHAQAFRAIVARHSEWKTGLALRDVLAITVLSFETCLAQRTRPIRLCARFTSATAPAIFTIARHFRILAIFTLPNSLAVTVLASLARYAPSMCRIWLFACWASLALPSSIVTVARNFPGFTILARSQICNLASGAFLAPLTCGVGLGSRAADLAVAVDPGVVCRACYALRHLDVGFLTRTAGLALAVDAVPVLRRIALDVLAAAQRRLVALHHYCAASGGLRRRGSLY
jgi:hypothetical protein